MNQHRYPRFGTRRDRKPCKDTCTCSVNYREPACRRLKAAGGGEYSAYAHVGQHDNYPLHEFSASQEKLFSTGTRMELEVLPARTWSLNELSSSYRHRLHKRICNEPPTQRTTKGAVLLENFSDEEHQSE